MDNVERIITATKICPERDLLLEQTWAHHNYAQKVDEMLAYHCSGAKFSQSIKEQISQLVHQGYVVINDTPIAVPVSSLMSSMELITFGKKSRGKLRNVSAKFDFEVQHAHFGESSFISENWLNYARRTILKKQHLSLENMYDSLMQSLSKPVKTGEWIVYSNHDGNMMFWCLWIHKAGDDGLIDLIRWTVE